MQPNRSHNFHHRQGHPNHNQNNQSFYNNQKEQNNLPQFNISHNTRNFQNQKRDHYQNHHQNTFNRYIINNFLFIILFI